MILRWQQFSYAVPCSFRFLRSRTNQLRWVHSHFGLLWNIAMTLSLITLIHLQCSINKIDLRYLAQMMSNKLLSAPCGVMNSWSWEKTLSLTCFFLSLLLLLLYLFFFIILSESLFTWSQCAVQSMHHQKMTSTNGLLHQPGFPNTDLTLVM